MNKKYIAIAILMVILISPVGCVQKADYGIVWDKLVLHPENPVINQPFDIEARAVERIGEGYTRIFHWVITDNGVQKEYRTAVNWLYDMVFTTPGRKGVLVWVETYNNPYHYKAQEFSAYFDVQDAQ